MNVSQREAVRREAGRDGLGALSLSLSLSRRLAQHRTEAAVRSAWLSCGWVITPAVWCPPPGADHVMLSLALSLAAVLLCAGLLVIWRVRTNGEWALWWHDNHLERLRDFVSGTTRPDRILRYVQRHAKPGDALGVISAVDSYCSKVEWAMNVGDKKGEILDAVVLETRPRWVLELGTYCGYSAVRIGRLLPPGARLVTIEMNPAYAQVAKEVIQHAGLDTQVELLVGSTTDLIPQLKKKFDIETFDLVFIDHWKVSYLPDTKLLEECGLLRAGSVLLADNVVCPGAPDYLQYVRDGPRYRSRHFPARLEYLQVEDGMEKSVFLG